MLLAYLLSGARSLIWINKTGVSSTVLREDARLDFGFGVPRTAIILSHTTGYRALLGLGQGRVRQFGEITTGSPKIGAFFSADIGKLRIFPTSKGLLLIYAMVPPCECDTFAVTTISQGTIKIGSDDFPATPDQTLCVWHVSPVARVYTIETSHGAEGDTIRLYTTDRADDRDLRSGGEMRVESGVSLIAFRAAGESSDRSYGIRVKADAAFPFVSVSALIPARGHAQLLTRSASREMMETNKQDANKHETPLDQNKVFWRSLRFLMLGAIIFAVARGVYLYVGTFGEKAFANLGELPKKWNRQVKKVEPVPESHSVEESFNEQLDYAATPFSTAAGVPKVVALTDGALFAATPSDDIDRPTWTTHPFDA